MTVQFLGTFAAYEIGGSIVLLTVSQVNQIVGWLAADDGMTGVPGKIRAIKAVRKWHRLDLRFAKYLVECIQAQHGEGGASPKR